MGDTIKTGLGTFDKCGFVKPSASGETILNTTIYCPDIECDSCVKVLTNTLRKTRGVEKFDIKKDSLTVLHDVSVRPEEIVSIINAHGYRASTVPFVRKTFAERFRDFRENRHKYELEYRMFKYSALLLLCLIGVELLAYTAFFRSVPDFLSRYAWWIFYLDLAVVSICAAMWHLKAYSTTVTSMVGMMIGMTFGMQSGLMIGSIMGATNGIFVGAMTGMIFATLVGFMNGKCCGIMGALEGMMAGLMNGIMGGMIGVMFFTDHILWFMPFFFLLNLIIMWGLSYMLFEELVESSEHVTKKPIPFSTFFSWSLIITCILTAIMIYGPKSGLARLG